MSQEINRLILDTYNKNMQWFKENNHDLYHKLNILERAITANKYTQKYELEIKEGYFDIYSIHDNQYIYKENSYLYAEQELENITFDNSSYNFNPYYTYKFDNDETVQQCLKQKPDVDFLSGTADILHYINNNLTSQKRKLNTINKYIFLGTGLGIHIDKFINGLDLKICLIIEPNIEIFRLSLFCINYAELSNTTQMYFAIASDNIDLSTISAKFLEEQYIYNNNIKFNIFTDDYKQFLPILQTAMVSQNHLIYPYCKHYRRALRPLEYWAKNYNFLCVKKFYDTFDFSHKPVLLLAPGPSLERNIKWLKKNKNKFVLATVGAAINILYKEDIKPDIIFSLEDKKVVQHFPDSIPKEYYHNCIFIATAVTDSLILSRFKKNKTFLVQAVTTYNQDLGQLFTPSVGEYSFLLLIVLGFSDLYLLGTDLSLDPDTNMTHTSSTLRNKVHTDLDIDNKLISDDGGGITLENNFTKVKGNFRNSVYTTPLFMHSIKTYSDILDMYRTTKHNIYNLSDGAYLKGIVPLKIDNLDLSNFTNISKTKLHKNIKHDILSISKNTLLGNDITILEDKIRNAYNILKILKDYEKNNKYYSDFNEYFMSVVILINIITGGSEETKSTELNELLSEYFKRIAHSIYEFFNSTELVKREIHIKNINNMLVSHLKKLVKYYIKQINKSTKAII